MPPPIQLPDIADGEDKTSPLKNRIRKNYRHIRKWAKRSATNAFRIYDRDIKEYPVTVDFYDNRFCIHFYALDADEPKDSLRLEVGRALEELFKVKADDIYWKVRKRRQKIEQYEKIASTNHSFCVYEYGLQFKVNLQDYLDTGLFLDHRETRHLIGKLSVGKRVLNLFAYTCAFSVHAAAKGATFTKSVDLSNTYTAWGKDNFLLNGLALKNNQIVRADCVPFLAEEIKGGSTYDIIIIDPPTISRSKKMAGKFDIQQNYTYLISQALRLLSHSGVIFFSTNFRKFSFDETLFPTCCIEDISKKTMPLDIRNKKIHSCWKITLSKETL